ncbi:hypothetical protein LTR53_011596 [Teratosphaeriaceae sp. CCFEE 6253]|nr:hypothetical protein LTR53_011596 [Teratosphaeriaceae sp. CCFEE 6253]
MASIFTFDPDPPRVASPWLHAATTSDSAALSVDKLPNKLHSDRPALSAAHDPNDVPQRLAAEPQEGPVEYKLHLLLRPRRQFKFISTADHIPGSKHSHFGPTLPSRSISVSALDLGMAPEPPIPVSATTQQTRQHRLQQLTTQLLWRLQQSSPHHTSSATNIILPSLPEALPELQAPQQPAKLLHGLEESQGALYEIGVADDGTLVGLAEDELLESLNNLRAMAACEWTEDAVFADGKRSRKVRRTGPLMVAEAFVKPQLHTSTPVAAVEGIAQHLAGPQAEDRVPSVTEQLRVTLTGPTKSGKSSLLGTLTTSTLDNGRGKSRLSMLKHRHEITSGVTSSVTSELLGYHDSDIAGVDVINYASENVLSWIDIHVAAADSRLVFVSDSAGHPRYRRTTVRSLVGWAPHWTLLCVPADDTEDTAGKTGSTSALQMDVGAASDVDLSSAQLDLCLRLGLPLVIVITKLDLASRLGLKGTLSKVLDALKAAGRKAAIVPNTPAMIDEGDLQTISAEAVDAAYNASLPLLNDPLDVVPIVLTSVVQGTGIRSLHALLHELPLPETRWACPDGLSSVFHIEDIYSKPAGLDGTTVISGLLRNGRISVGDSLTVGPFSAHDHFDDSEDSDERPRRHSHLPTSRSFPGASRDSLLAHTPFQLPGLQWRAVVVTSIRNLRLPVHSLSADQVGTLAIRLQVVDGKEPTTSALASLHKGMVLASSQPLVSRSLVAKFRREDLEALAVGNHVVIYVASVRASARVVSARAPDSPVIEYQGKGQNGDAGHDAFSFDDVGEASNGAPVAVAGSVTAPDLLVTFRLDAAKEFIIVGDQILVMPGGGPGLYGGLERGEKGVAGLEGFVGVIVETHG